VAKKDNSIVFQEVRREGDTKIMTLMDSIVSQYKSNYDLLERTSAPAGPSRTTRRAHTERVQNLTAPLTSPAHIESELPLSIKSKGKQKAIEPAVNGSVPSESVRPIKHGKTKSISQPPKLRVRTADPILPGDSEISISVGPVRGKKRNIAITSPIAPPTVPPAKKRRKLLEALTSESVEIPTAWDKSTGSDDASLEAPQGPSQISARRKSLVSAGYLLWFTH